MLETAKKENDKVRETVFFSRNSVRESLYENSLDESEKENFADKYELYGDSVEENDDDNSDADYYDDSYTDDF